MSQTLQFKQAWHLDPALLDSASRNIDPAGLAGRWVNTNHETRGISELTLEHDGKTNRVAGIPPLGRLTGADDGARLRRLRRGRLDRRRACGLERRRRQCRDGSGRSNYVTREFFYRSG